MVKYLLFLALVVVPLTAQNDLAPYPLAPRFHWQAFPSDLYCEDIEDVSEGQIWGDITIGISSVDDLKHYVASIGDYHVTQYADFISFERIPNVLDGSGIPPLIEACLDIPTQTVTVVRVSVNRLIYIQDVVAKYSIPDVVTWGNSTKSRTAFWFEEGIAISVWILERNEVIDYGEIGLIVYIPYQATKGFEARYPYNRTNSKNPVDGDHFYDPPPSEAQNPFTFEGMIATITVEPSRTPTPTFAPVASTSTPTATTAP
jgi:hypothetical protein